MKITLKIMIHILIKINRIAIVIKHKITPHKISHIVIMGRHNRM